MTLTTYDPWHALFLVLCLIAGSVRADVVALISSKSALTTLSKIEITDIFLGRSARFPDGSRAVPIDLREGATLRDEFYAKIAGKSADQIKAHWSKIIFTGRGQPPRTVSNSEEAKKLIEATPGAICYIERNSIDASVKILSQP